MTTTYKQFIQAALIGTIFFTSCSRPTAYFQRSPVEAVHTYTTQAVGTVIPPMATSLYTESVTSENAVDGQPTAYVRNDNKLMVSQKLGKRIDRMKQLLAASPGTLDPVAAPHTLNLVERVILRKINKKIAHRLAPAHPEKAMLSKGPILIGGAVLLLGGLLLLIMGTGTAAFIGLIAALIGALGVILGLFEY